MSERERGRERGGEGMRWREGGRERNKSSRWGNRETKRGKEPYMVSGCVSLLWLLYMLECMCVMSYSHVQWPGMPLPLQLATLL